MRAFQIKTKRRRASVIVEFAFTAPVFFMLLFGAVEFSRLMMLRHTATAAAYEGARFGLVPGATAEESVQRVEEYITAAGMTNATITVTPSPITEETTQVTVNVAIPVGSNSWAVPNWVSGDKSIVGQATLFTERVPAILSASVADPTLADSGTTPTTEPTTDIDDD